MQEGVPHRWFAITAQECRAGTAAFRKTPDRLLALGAEHEFDLPELIRLESARRLEPRSKRQKLERRHGFEDVQLRDEHLQDGEDAFEGVLRTVRVVGGQQLTHA